MKNQSRLDTWVVYAYKENNAGPAENDVEEDLRRYRMMCLDWKPVYIEPPFVRPTFQSESDSALS